jgi:microcystin-dependent protein
MLKLFASMNRNTTNRRSFLQRSLAAIAALTTTPLLVKAENAPAFSNTETSALGVEPFIGAVVPWPGNFAPRGWAFCLGQTLPINQNQALFSLLGTTYGGNGQTTFQLPDLRGRMAIGSGQLSGGSSYTLGAIAGSETVTLTASQVAPVSIATQNIQLRGTGTQGSGASEGGTTGTGSGQSVSNMPPYIAVNYIIALQGIFPSRN